MLLKFDGCKLKSGLVSLKDLQNGKFIIQTAKRGTTGSQAAAQK